MGFLCSLLFLAFFVTDQANGQKCTCNEVCTILKDMKKQLSRIQTDVNILKGRSVKKGNMTGNLYNFLYFACCPELN